MNAVSASGVAVVYNGHAVIDGISLQVSFGEWVGVVGPNGAGKSTLLRALAGLVPYRGEVEVAGNPARALRRHQLARLVALVPQAPLLPAGMSVLDYALLGRTPHLAYLGVEGRHDLEVVAEVLDRLDLAPLAGRELASLSGGERQRVVLARALAQEASIVLFDEPTSALDVGHQQKALDLVESLRRDRGLTVVSATHDLTLAGRSADRILMLAGGRLVAEGLPGEVLTEEAIATHYGASVKVLDDPELGLAVIPTRAPRSARQDGEASGMRGR